MAPGSFGWSAVGLQPRRALKRFSLIGAFPGELDIVAAEVAVGGGSAVDGLTQFQVADDRAGAQVCIA